MTTGRKREVSRTRYSDFDGSKSSERSVRLDRTEGHIIIEGRAYPARELIEALAQSGYAELRAVGDSLILGSKRITPIFKSRQDKAMASLCHGSLAYCCPLSKRCAERDRALEILGLSEDDYVHLKKTAHAKFIESARGAGSPDTDWSSEYQRDNIANRPAIDTGYGSDDYRRDFESLDRTMRSLEEHYGSQDERYGDERSSSGRRYSQSERRGPYDDLSRVVGQEEDRSCGVCSTQREESLEGIGSLFAQGELSPFADEPKEETREHSFCFSCGRSIRAENRVCPFCGARQ
ncbi:hypothetical protein EU545_05380 [Candidatus Thorarchaeota archaeon]|jgi:hypothetical protein|nr:MAG: hypothetical protein EU545_05380 [Candidatus Thorarchaeota archaeon]